MHRTHHRAVSFLNLLASSSTLVCCALPALIVSLGAGSALASAFAAYPHLSWIGTHKGALFAVSGCILLLSGIWRYRQRHAPCPVDPHLAQACARTRRWSGVLYGVSVTLYATGFSFAYILPRLIG